MTAARAKTSLTELGSRAVDAHDLAHALGQVELTEVDRRCTPGLIATRRRLREMPQQLLEKNGSVGFAVESVQDLLRLPAKSREGLSTPPRNHGTRSSSRSCCGISRRNDDVSAWIESGSAHPIDLGELDLPESVREVVARRTARLPMFPVNDVLALAAVICAPSSTSICSARAAEQAHLAHPGGAHHANRRRARTPGRRAHGPVHVLTRAHSPGP